MAWQRRMSPYIIAMPHWVNSWKKHTQIIYSFGVGSLAVDGTTSLVLGTVMTKSGIWKLVIKDLCVCVRKRKNCACNWFQWTHTPDPITHQLRIPQCTIVSQKCAQVCTFLLRNGVLWDIDLMHYGICEMVLIASYVLHEITSLIRFTLILFMCYVMHQVYQRSG